MLHLAPLSAATPPPEGWVIDYPFSQFGQHLVLRSPSATTTGVVVVKALAGTNELLLEEWRYVAKGADFWQFRSFCLVTPSKHDFECGGDLPTGLHIALSALAYEAGVRSNESLPSGKGSYESKTGLSGQLHLLPDRSLSFLIEAARNFINVRLIGRNVLEPTDPKVFQISSTPLKMTREENGTNLYCTDCVPEACLHVRATKLVMSLDPKLEAKLLTKASSKW